jgi:thioredoxin-dependent peroxiredoxin
MTLRLGDIAPDFTAISTAGEIRFHDWIGDGWAILFSHPRDFTPVCTTELGAVARLKPEFDRRGVKVIGLSVDGVSDHDAWSRDIEATQGVALNFPLIADKDRSIAQAYDMLHPNAEATATVRSVFVIDPARKIRLTLTYPASTGRDFDEILRAIDSLQLTSTYQVATPANWRRGDDVIILGSVTDEQAREAYPAGWRAERPYLRYVPDPSTPSEDAA